MRRSLRTPWPRAIVLSVAALVGGCFDEASRVEPDAAGSDGPTSVAMASATGDGGATTTGEAVTDSGSAAETASESGGGGDAADDSTGAGDGSGEETGSPRGVVVGPLPIAADVDDGQIRPGRGAPYAWFTSGEPGGAQLGESGDGGAYAGYFRFVLPTAIPLDATVVDARLRLVGRSATGWNPETDALEVAVQDAADAALVASGSAYPYDGNAGAVALRAARVRWPESGGLAWAVGGVDNASPDLSPLLQGLIDAHGGLAAGAHVQLWVAADAMVAAGRSVGFYDFYEDPAQAATLELTYALPR